MNKLTQIINDLNLGNVTPKTWITTISVIITVANIILKAFGVQLITVAPEEIYTAISSVVVSIAALYAVWHNCSFTNSAQEADEYKDEIKNRKEEEIEIILEDEEVDMTDPEVAQIVEE